MKELPILFSTPMILALLDGRKTQTRRIVKPQLTTDVRSGALGHWSIQPDVREFVCPFGAPGDRLWVKEAHAFSVVDPDGLDWHDDPENWDVIYRADEHQPAGGWRDADGKPMTAPWRPSIHMPRWASRITLEIVGVRVERLQSISEEDARAEGAKCADEATGREVIFPGASKAGSYRLHYRHIWEQINGPDSWDANPWVIEFRRVS